VGHSNVILTLMIWLIHQVKDLTQPHLNIHQAWLHLNTHQELIHTVNKWQECSQVLMDNNQWLMENNQWVMGNNQWHMDNKQWHMDSNR
jgi:hypothetical protein